VVDNQHKKITGYRELTEDEIALMNKVKAKAEEVGELIKELENSPGLDPRWIAIAKTDLQIGFMIAVRAVAQPKTF